MARIRRVRPWALAALCAAVTLVHGYPARAETWDVEFPLPWLPPDALGSGLAPHQGEDVRPGVNVLNGNLTLAFGPMIYNSLGHSAKFKNVGGGLVHGYDGGTTRSLGMKRLWERDRALYSAAWNLGLYDLFVHSTGEGYVLYLADRSPVVFVQDGIYHKSTRFTGMQMSASSTSDYLWVRFPDGTEYTFQRVKDAASAPCKPWYELVYYDQYPFFALIKVRDRFGNETKVHRANPKCRITEIEEKTVDDSETYRTRFGYDTADRLNHITFFSGTTATAPGARSPEEHFWIDYYSGNLVSIAFGPPDDLANQVAVCFQYVTGRDGKLLRSTEGPFKRALGAGWASYGYCHPEAPSPPLGRAPIAPVTRFWFDALGRLREIVGPDNMGFEIFFSPDRKVRISRTWPGTIVRSALNYLTLEIEGEGTAAAVGRRVDNFGRWWKYTRDPRGNLTKVEAYDGSTRRYEYGDTALPDLVTKHTDEGGRETRWTYDKWGNVLTYIPPAGRRMTAVYRSDLFMWQQSPFYGTLSSVTYTGTSKWRDGVTEETITEVISYETSKAPDGHLIIVERSNPGMPGEQTTKLELTKSGRPMKFTDANGIGRRADSTGTNSNLFQFGEGNERKVGALGFSPSNVALERVENALAEVTTIDHAPGGPRVTLDAPDSKSTYVYDDMRELRQVLVQPKDTLAVDQSTTATVEQSTCSGGLVELDLLVSAAACTCDPTEGDLLASFEEAFGCSQAPLTCEPPEGGCLGSSKWCEDTCECGLCTTNCISYGYDPFGGGTVCYACERVCCGEVSPVSC